MNFFAIYACKVPNLGVTSNLMQLQKDNKYFLDDVLTDSGLSKSNQDKLGRSCLS